MMSTLQWHYMQGSQSVGPFSEEQICAMVRSGTLDSSALIWAQGSETWKSAKDVFDINDDVPPPLPKQSNESPLIQDVQLESKWASAPPHPWRRYFARMIDILVNGYFILFSFSTILWALTPRFAQEFSSVFEKPEGGLIDAILTTFMSTFLTAAFIGFTGTSIGKWFFGIRVLDKNNKPLGYKKAFKREMMVWARGLALGIPNIALFTNYSAYEKLLKDGNTTWDEELGCQVLYRRNSMRQMLLRCLGVIFFLCFLSVMRSLN
jgi:uncharacterized RDD family membrane protein YckC